jgi:ribA/ribD-fused uncharacterized protein
MKWDQNTDEYVNNGTSIKGFAGENRWLSNFWPCVIVFEDMEFKNSEAAFQAAKTKFLVEREPFQIMEAGKAKRAGKELTLRHDWEEVKLQIMYNILKDKFCRNPELAVKLLETGDKYLEETNWWNDTYWGVCRGVGQNQLGIILMRVRDELKLNQC